MRIRRVCLAPFRLPLSRPVRSGAGEWSAREGVLVTLHASPRLEGVGEATPIPGFCSETSRESFAALLALAPALVGEDVRGLDALLDGIERASPATPAARAALDMALHDLLARIEGRSVAAQLARGFGVRARTAVTVSALLVAREPGALAREASEAVRAGFGTLKLKVAGATVAEDVARVAAVRRAVGPDVALRLDANGGWKEEEAAAALARLPELGIELVEQPVDAHDLHALARIRASSAIPIVADESAAGEARARRVIELRAADAICLKVSAAGGLRAAGRIAARARRAALGVIVTSGLDGAVARAAARALAAALPGERPASGLATAGFLAADLAPAEIARDGRLPVSASPGLGVVPAPAALDAVASGPVVEFGEGAA